MQDNESRKWLYQTLQKEGYNVGKDYEEFENLMITNEDSRRWCYDRVSELGYNVGKDYDEFNALVGPSKIITREANLAAGVDEESSRARMAQQQTERNTGTPGYVPSSRWGLPTQQQPVTPATMAANPQYVTQQGQGETYTPSARVKTPTAQRPRPMAPAPRAGQWSGAPMQQTPYAPTEAEGDLSFMPIEQGEDTRQAYAGRKQAKRDLWQQQSDNVESLLAASEKRDMEAGTKRTIFTDYGSEEVVTPKRSNETRELRAAQRALRNTQRIINAADNEAGFGQGLKERVFDIDNWDFGITDITDLNALKRAMDAFDKGEKLTESQQALLDAKALEMAVNVYFASDLSKGYQAGQDIAGSLPFMAEFMLGIGSAASKATSKALVKYFTKRFAKAMENKVVNTAVRGGARVLRDLERAAIITGTTGAVGTEADARQRMMGQVRYNEDEQGKVTYAGHTQGEDEWKARRKAATARTLTNFSEMFGEYLGLLGKGGRWLSGTKGGKFFGLDKVAGFIDNVASSEIGSFIGRIESKAQFHGAVGEMAEELFDGITNATFVGDQTLQDVFDKENLTRTALSVGIMSMFFSGAKLGGYGVVKGFNAADMAVRTRRADRAAANAFASNNRDEVWNWVRRDIDKATAEDAADIIQGMYESGEYTDEQLQAVLNYAIYKKGNEMIERYKANNQTMQEAAAEQSYNTGYEDANTDELRSDINTAYTDARQKLVEMIGEDNVSVIDEDPLGMQRLYDNDPNVSDEVTMAVAEYVSAKSAWDGVQQRINDDAEDNAEEKRDTYRPMMREDGTIHPVTLNVEGDDGQPKTVYLLDGSDVSVNPDGSIDRENSSPTLTVYDPEQGKNVFLDDPYGDRGIQSVGEVLTAEAYEAQIEAERQAEVRERMGGGDRRDGGQVVRTPGAPEAYTPGMVMGVVDNAGQEHEAEVVGRVRYDRGKFVPDENGMFVEYTVDGQTKHEALGSMNDMVRWHEAGGVDRIEGEQPQQPITAAEQVTLNLTPGAKVHVSEFGETAEVVSLDEDGKNVTVRFEDGNETTTTKDMLQAVEAAYRGHMANNGQNSQPQQPITAAVGQTPTGTAETPTEGGNAAEDTRTPAQRTYDDMTAKYGEKASHKVDVTLKDRKATLDGKKKALDKAQTDYDDAPIGKEDKAEAALAKAQEEYDNALADYNAWDEVRKLRDQALIAKAEAEDAARKAELERKRAAETEAQRKQREEYEAEQARRREQAERLRQEDAERLKAQIEKEKQEQSNPQPNEPAAPIEGTKGSRSQLAIAREEMADNPEALAMLDDLEPRSLDEIAATLLGGGKRSVKLQREEFKRHTGYSEGEMKRYPFIFASKENGGVTIERLGEMVANEAVNENIPFDELDAMAGANAVLDMLSSVYSQGDINNYIQNKRIAEAREYYNKVKSEAYAIMLDAYGMTEGEYEAYMSWLEDAIEQGKSTLSDEEFNQLFNVYEQGQETDAARGDREGAETTERTESAETDVSQNGERRNGEADEGTAEQPQQPAIETAQQPKEKAEGGTDTAPQPVGGATAQTETAQAIAAAEAETDTSPTEGQKEAGNYKKGHVRIDGYDITIEQPKGSVRRGTDKNGRARTMTAAESKRRKEREEINRAIDKATSLISGKSIAEVRKERIEREEKRREQTKEIYEIILSNEFNDVSLQKINDYLNDVTPNNPYGRRLSERLPQRVERKLYERARENAVDALFSRASESAVAPNGRTREEGRREVEERKKKALEAWAKATGNWHTELTDFTDDTEPIGHGTDSDVYLSKDGSHVVKMSHGKLEGKRFRPDIDNIPLFNYVFPNSAYRILGYGDFGKGFVRILEQPYVDFSTSTPLTERERVEYMEGLGFKSINDANTAFSNGEIVVADLQKSNIVRDAAGNISVLDADCKLHTRDVGGTYEYLPVEHDLPLGGQVKFFRTESGEAYGFTMGGKIYLDPKIATAETPVHEYTHLWAAALRAANPKAWEQLKNELEKDKELVAYVRGLYPELAELAELAESNGANGLSDELAEEVFAYFSGRRGAERLREEQRKAMDEASDYVEKAGVVAMFERLRDALKKFWNMARDLFAGKTRGIKSMSAEDFADMVLGDLVSGVKPDRGDRLDRSDRERDDDIQYEKVGGDENDNRAVTIIGAEKEHGFANFGEARKWAKKNIVGEYNNPEIGGVNISGTAIDKYLSEKAVSKSDNKDVHLSALKVMPSIIENSIVGEVHEDKKGDRHLKDVVRLYGAIDIDGQSYRVKTTVKRYNSENEKSKAYSYEVTEIELLEGTHGDDNNGELPRSGNNSISAAKLLNISETAKNNSQETEREEIAQRDKEYSEAVAAGDKEKIDAMLREEMRRKGYADNSDYQGSLAFNGAAPSSNAYFETREERKEAFDNGELEGDFSLGDFMEAGIDTHDLEWQLANPIAASARDKATLESINNLRSAVRGKKKTIKMYRAVPADLKEGSFRNGDWVTPSRKYAEQHIELQDWEGGRIIEQEVSVDDIWWNGDDINEWGFDDGKGYAYKNTENNRKLMEPTYDDNGNLIPLSERFTDTESDVRFRGEEANAGEWYDRNSVERIGEFAGYSPKQIAAMNARQEESARRQFNDAAEKLHLGDTITFADSIDDVPVLTDKQRKEWRRKKGWFDPRTGKIVIILGNHRSMDDVMKSIMHEGVAHHGLRQMFGKHFDTFLDNVYLLASSEIRERINDMAKKHGWDFREATEEYLAMLAEDTEFERPENQSWWSKVKALFFDMLHRIGFKLDDVYECITDNELRYILWRSYQNLVNPGRYNSVVEEAKDVAKQYELKVGEWDETWTVAAEAEPNATMEFNGRRVPIWATNGRTGNRADRAERNDSTERGKDYEKLKKKYPAHMIVKREGDFYLIEGEDAKKAANLLGYEMSKVNGIDAVAFPAYLIDEYLPKLVGAGVKVAIADNVAADGVAEDGVRFRDGEDEETIDDLVNNPSIDTDTRYTALAAGMAMYNAQSLEAKTDAIRAVTNNLTRLRSDMAKANRIAKEQKKYDKGTVKRVTDLARVMVSAGHLDGTGRADMKELLAAIRESTGNEDNTANVNRIMDIMVKNQLRNMQANLKKLLSIKGSKVDAKGVNVQGKLDPNGQQVIKAFKENMGEQESTIQSRIADCEERMTSSDKSVADAAYNERAGLMLALDYLEKVGKSVAEEKDIEAKKRDELSKIYDIERVAVTDADGNVMYKQDGEPMTREVRHVKAAYKNDRNNAERAEVEQTVEAMDDAIRHMRMRRIDAYSEFIGQVAGHMKESMKKAAEFREAEKQRIEEIHHNANSDMEGRPAEEHYKPKFKDKLANNSFVRLLLEPLLSFEQMMRLFGSKSANGEGYLYNRFVRGWVEARQKELKGYRAKMKELDNKVKELFAGEKVGIVTDGGVIIRKDIASMGDLIRWVRNLPKLDVEVRNGGEMKPIQLEQGNLLYVYMVNKMSDGRMKLRHMGITDEEIAVIESKLDPRLKSFADWVQNDFLVRSRNEYNETHKRIFGANMAAIEDYFPLKILSNARQQTEEELDQHEWGEGITTVTGAIKQRTINILPLDLLGANALSVLSNHVAEMEHWNAYAEFNRDLNTLRTYTKFKNRVLNMASVYGSGEELWENFNNACQIATGSYRPAKAKNDKAAVNIAKGATGAKVAFRINTALKQFLSMIAYMPDVRPDLWAKNIATPWKSWRWAMENLPIFKERWLSRIAGDPRLLKSEKDWRMWRSRVVELAARVGMTPNAFVDALTVSVGAKTIYESRKARYLKEGYSETDANKRAIQDAEIGPNQTQQSSESIFLSTIQVDRTWWAVMWSVFRNNSMGYQRQLHDALRNLKRDIFHKGNREESIEFMTKQMIREGISEKQAIKNAKARYDRQIGKDVLRVATFGFLVEFIWNLGSHMWYYLFGDDDDEKKAMFEDDLAKSYFGSIEGLTGGDMLSQAGQFVVQGEGNPDYLRKQMPAASDMYDVAKEMSKGQWGEAATDIVNLAIQVGIGVNPQSITDGILACFDICGGDLELEREALICVARIMQVPQSQIEQMYFDELGLSGKEVKNMSVEQLVERYAKYNVKRRNIYTPWLWDEEELIEKERERADRIVRERLEGKDEKTLSGMYEDDGMKKMIGSILRERLEGKDEKTLSGMYEDDGMKKMIGSITAKRLGEEYGEESVSDNYGSGSALKTKYGPVYAKHRDYVDMAEDITLNIEIRQATEAGDAKKLANLKKAKKFIDKQREMLVDAGGNAKAEEEIKERMEWMRIARRGALNGEEEKVWGEKVKERAKAWR